MDNKSTGNFAQITMSLLPKFSSAGKHTFHYDEYVLCWISLCVNSFCSPSSSRLSIPFSSKFDFHVLNDNGISYIALSDRDLPLRIAFVSRCCTHPHLSLELPRRSYAEFRQHLWVLDFAVFPSIPSDRVKTSQAYSMSDFASTLHKIMVRFLSPIRCD